MCSVVVVIVRKYEASVRSENSEAGRVSPTGWKYPTLTVPIFQHFSRRLGENKASDSIYILEEAEEQIRAKP